MDAGLARLLFVGIAEFMSSERSSANTFEQQP
jgi:hypothetical protein